MMRWTLSPYWYWCLFVHIIPQDFFTPQKQQSLNILSQGVGEAEEVLRLDYGQTGRPSWRRHTLRAPSQQSDEQQTHKFTSFFGCFCVLTLDLEKVGVDSYLQTIADAKAAGGTIEFGGNIIERLSQVSWTCAFLDHLWWELVLGRATMWNPQLWQVFPMMPPWSTGEYPQKDKRLSWIMKTEFERWKSVSFLAVSASLSPHLWKQLT